MQPRRELKDLKQVKVVESAPQSLILMIYMLSTFTVDTLSTISICLSMSSLALSIVTSQPQTASKNFAVFLTLSFGMIHKLLAFSMFAVSFSRAMIILCAILNIMNYVSYAVLSRIENRASIPDIITCSAASKRCCPLHFISRLILTSVSFLPLLFFPVFTFQENHLGEIFGKIVTVSQVCVLTCVSIGVGLYASLSPLTPFAPHSSFLIWHIVTSVLYVGGLVWCFLKRISLYESL